LDADAEAAAIQRLEVELAAGTRPLPGALDAHTGVPRHARAVVTSGARDVATARLAAAGIPAPAVLVTADDVEYGKPHPQPYADAVRRLGRPAGQCIAIEDSANGARSAKRAGLTVIGVGTRDPELSSAADHVIGGMRDLAFTTEHVIAAAA
jgi:sugar-phosphatase